MFRIKLLLIIGGGFLAYYGYKEWRVSFGTSSEPAAVELASLEGGGELPNNHIKIGQHVAVYAACVYEYEQKKGQGGPNNGSKVTHTYYPIISEDHKFFVDLAALSEKYESMDNVPDAEWPDIDNFKVLVKTKKFKTIGSIPDGLSPTSSLQGLVINSIEGMDKEEKALVKSSFPKENFDQLLILEQGRKPASLVKSLGCAIGGLLLSVLGIGSFFMGSEE